MWDSTGIPNVQIQCAVFVVRKGSGHSCDWVLEIKCDR